MLSKGILIVLSLHFLSILPRLAAQEPGPADAKAAFQSLKSGETRVLAPGVYRLPESGILIEGIRDVVIEGKGVKLLASSFKANALRLVNCQNVVVRGITLDYDPLPFTQATVSAIDSEARTIDFKIHEGYPELSDAYLVRHLHLFRKDGVRWKPGVPDYYAKNVKRLDAGTGRAQFSKDARGFGQIGLGDKIALSIRRMPGIVVGEGCRKIQFEDVTINSAPGIAMLVRFAEDGGTFRNVRVVPGEPPAGAKEPRLMSSSADALNIAYTRGGPVVENCEFSYMGDDSVNLHGVMLPVLKWVDKSTFLTMRPQPGEEFDTLLRKGDLINFLASDDFRPVASAHIEQVEKASEDSGAWAEAARGYWPTMQSAKGFGFFKVALDKPMDAIPAGTYTEIPASNASGFVIRNSYFHDHRARSLRLMSCDGVVEGNTFERIKGAAISIGPQFPFWAEAGWSHNLSIRKNAMSDVAEGSDVCLKDSYTLGAISISCRVDTRSLPPHLFAGNTNIVIADNLIDGCSVDGINVSSAKDIQITGNTIKRVNLCSCPDAGKNQGLRIGGPIAAPEVGVSIEDNHIK